MMKEWVDPGADVLFPLEAKPPVRVAAGAAVQHLLAIFASIVTPALIVCGLCGATPELTRHVAGMSLFISGVSTFIQIHRFGVVGSGLLSIQGTSSSFIAIFAGMAAAGVARGEAPEQMLGLMLGMGLVCALVEVGLSQVLPWLRRIITPLVAGIVITLIGLTLVKVAAVQIGGGAAALAAGTFGAKRDILLALFSAVVVLAMNRSRRPWCRMGALMGGIVAGTLAAAATGAVEVPHWDGAWVALPVPFRIPLAFRWEWVLPMVLMYVATTVESLGDITATSMVSGEPTEGTLYERRLSGGILADGLNSMMASMFGAFPTTSFSQNNGVIQLTGVASRRVGMWIALFLVLAGLVPGVSWMVTLVPRAVLGGVTLVMFGTVASTGIRLMGSAGFGRKSLLVVATSLGAGLAVTMEPRLLSQFPGWVQQLFGSGIMTGTLAAIAAQALAGRDGAGKAGE
ncbi:MAG: purine/pyrimidine permease [Lentisphaerae bacterium]|nr:purine/pyrimidine permease [Lentisphaerota bacterium]